MPAIVDLKEAVAVAGVPHDVAAGVAARAAGLLGGDRCKQAWVEVVTRRRSRDLGTESDVEVGVHAPPVHAASSR
jgi:hypothetical protein